MPASRKGSAARPEAASSVAPIGNCYRRSLRPCLETTIAPLQRATFRQTLLGSAPMDFSATTAAWIAIAACALAVVAFGIVLLLFRRIRRLREGQMVLLGGGKSDLVDFAVSLQGRIDDLHRAVDEVAAGLARVDRRVDATVSNTSIVRYDAYEGAGGHQSASLVFLDAGRSGVVVSAIQGRDYARIYVKELDRGRPNVALSPEEEEAVERAMAG